MLIWSRESIGIQDAQIYLVLLSSAHPSYWLRVLFIAATCSLPPSPFCLFRWLSCLCHTLSLPVFRSSRSSLCLRLSRFFALLKKAELVTTYLTARLPTYPPT